MNGSGKRRRGPALGLAAAAAFAIGGVLVVRAVTGDDGDDTSRRFGSTIVADAPETALERATAPTAVRIEYDVTVGARGDRTSGVDVFVARRPFDARLTTFVGDDTSGDPATTETATFARQAAEGTSASTVVLAVPPGPSPIDTRIGVVLDAAVELGVAERHERREVLGEQCDVYRTFASLAASDFLPPTAGQFHDTCIDARGLVLEEVLVVDDEIVVRRVACEIDLDVDIDPDIFDVGEPTLATEQGGGFVAEMVPGSRRPGAFFEPEAPDGFTLDGRYAVVPPQAENFEEFERRDQRRTLVADVFVDGIDVVVFEQGSTLGGAEAYPGFRGVPIPVDGFEGAEVSFGRTGPIVLVVLDGGRFLHVRGTTTLDVLVGMLEHADEVEGGELELLDP